MERIKSFQRDHTKIEAGLYLQERKRNVDIYDLRFVRPNTDFIDIKAIHTIEHLFASYLKSNLCYISDDVISFCVGGCQTMFYLEVFNDSFVSPIDVRRALQECCDWALDQAEVIGATEAECGNYRSHDLPEAKRWIKKYKKVLDNYTIMC